MSVRSHVVSASFFVHFPRLYRRSAGAGAVEAHFLNFRAAVYNVYLWHPSSSYFGFIWTSPAASKREIKAKLRQAEKCHQVCVPKQAPETCLFALFSMAAKVRRVAPSALFGAPRWSQG